MDLVSATLTVPAFGSIAKLTIIVLPAATPPAGTVTLRLVFEVIELACPMLVGAAILTVRLPLT